MKSTILGLCFLITSGQWSNAQSRQDNSSTGIVTAAEQEIINLSKQKWLWMSDKNIDSLNALFDEKSVFVHMGEAGGRLRNSA